jgi:hypothetical protein
MKECPDIYRIAALIGDPAQTTSSHLAKLEAVEMIACRKSGRHKYFTLGDDDVGHALEALMALAAGAGHLRTRTGPKDLALREARVCYSHLAGVKGIALYQGLLVRGVVVESGDAVVLTDAGPTWLRDFGVNVDRLRQSKTPLCRSCLDWSARQTHLAGSVGRALLAQM